MENFQRRKGGTVVPPSDFQSERTETPLRAGVSAKFSTGAPLHMRAHNDFSGINVLIACEESQTECLAFRALGANAFSCDILPCSGGHPEWHICGDVRPLLNGCTVFQTADGSTWQLSKWHLIIAHPPCTYLSRGAGRYLYSGHQLNEQRYKLGLQAAQFFMECYNAKADYVAVENPTPFKIFNLPRPTTFVQPFQFGEAWQKKTLLWLKNLPPLMPTLFAPSFKSYVHCTKGGKKRSKSFPSIARAMAKQWLPFIKQQH